MDTLFEGITCRTFGPAYDPKKDANRVMTQHEVIKGFMLNTGKWWTLQDLRYNLNYPESSISAQLRHLRKKEFGSYIVERRRRSGGTWEYRVREREVTK